MIKNTLTKKCYLVFNNEKGKQAFFCSFYMDMHYKYWSKQYCQISVISPDLESSNIEKNNVIPVVYASVWTRKNESSVHCYKKKNIYI